jgi:N-acetylmuramoyl-L-alanine amidase
MNRRNNCIKRFRAAAGYIITILFAAALFGFAYIQASAYQRVNTGVVVLDAGHGGIDGGAVRNGLLEKNINLSLTLKLKALLEHKGYTVVMTRDKDVSLDNLNQSSSSRHKRDLIARVGIINGCDAQIFISIHINSLVSDPSENGSIVYYSGKYPQSKALANFLQKELNAVKPEGTERKQQRPLVNRYYILGCSRVPGVLIEAAFITNLRECEMLKTELFLDRLAAAAAEGTDRFLKSESDKIRRY